MARERLIDLVVVFADTSMIARFGVDVRFPVDLSEDLERQLVAGASVSNRELKSFDNLSDQPAPLPPLPAHTQ